MNFPEGNEQILLEEEKELDSIFDPLDILKKLPGITEGNFERVTNSVSSLSQLSTMSQAEMQKIIGKKNGKTLYDFFHQNGFQQIVG